MSDNERPMDPWAAQLEYYRKWGEQEVAGANIYVCNLCGALVGWGEQETHEVFHQKIEEVLRG